MAGFSEVIDNGQVNKQQVRQHFSCHAREYDRYARVQQKVASKLAGMVKEQTVPIETALEVGCGTGFLTRQLIQGRPELRMTLSDLAHGMSCHVGKMLPETAVCDADAAALPFRDGSFGLLATSSVYQWLNDLPNAFAEISRVLCRSGLFAMAMFAEKTLYELRESHQAVLPAGKKSHMQSFPSVNMVAEALSGQLEILSLQSEFEVEWHRDVPELLKCLKKIGAQNASQQRPGGMASRQVMQAMMQHYRLRYGSDTGIPATYEVIYLLARNC